MSCGVYRMIDGIWLAMFLWAPPLKLDIDLVSLIIVFRMLNRWKSPIHEINYECWLCRHIPIKYLLSFEKLSINYQRNDLRKYYVKLFSFNEISKL